ncbi:T9SS type A sorting domain-containing protein [Hymenobacter jejuensis]|uniref:T9SS type A sorting domain-containing protein n=1 Tax=Hymenobacter jejuensis TaxID=2502781 RepID=A0A5B7ZWK9_9BACT|nr:T9SS type A sorting domain-containing protein [Hymenobacter jejuensis]QDA58995.1 T9SS type A sorting domain-containing protein [Hymenobacter jejuensis]
MICPKYLLLLLLPFAAQAQVVAPLPTDAARGATPTTNTARRGTQATLPFFEDFTTPREGQPNPDRWQRSGALVNNRFPVAPPSRGVVTLDGLKANGQPYGSSSAYSDTDTLTSQPFNLNGFTASNRVYLSFFWQAGSIVGPAKTNSGTQPVALQLEFLDNAQRWQLVWEMRSTGERKAFRQKLIAIDQPQYLHSAFQFRFRSIGNLGTTRDAWSLDYIKLDRNRSVADSSYRDISTSAPLTSLLKRYAAMPYWQYNANPTPTNELNDRTTTTINNFDVGPAPTPITWSGTLQVLPSGPAATFLNGNQSLPASQQQAAIAGDVRGGSVAIPLSGEAKRIRHSIVLQTNEQDPLTIPNDSISRITELADYYAYDDGTAEAAVSLPALASGPASYFAYRIDLNKSDYVRALRIYPVLPNAAGRAITINVWDKDPAADQPAAQPKASKSFTIAAQAPGGNGFVEIPFDAPVPVTGTFYVGYGQASISQFVQFGLDLNSAPPANYLFYNAQQSWSATQTSPAGAPLMRPVLTNGVATAVADPRTAASIGLYPNPSNGIVYVQGRFAQATVSDALGRSVWQQPAAQAGHATLDLSQLPAGVYIVQLSLPNGLTVAKRLVLTK